jgi:hypothetical protein
LAKGITFLQAKNASQLASAPPFFYKNFLTNKYRAEMGLSAFSNFSASVPAIRCKPRRSATGQSQPGAFHCCPAAFWRKHFVQPLPGFYSSSGRAKYFIFHFMTIVIHQLTIKPLMLQYGQPL